MQGDRIMGEEILGCNSDLRIKHEKVAILSDRCFDNNCQHNYLKSFDNFTGLEINFNDKTDSKICGQFMYKKYKCLDCGKMVVVLNAVVEEIE
jgi:hypothetical protein